MYSLHNMYTGYGVYADLRRKNTSGNLQHVIFTRGNPVTYVNFRSGLESLTTRGTHGSIKYGPI